MILHASGRSALWTVTGHTSYLILIGLTIEISFLFLVSGVAFVKQLPADPRARSWGINNRLVFALASSAFCVASSCSCTRPASSTGTTGGGTSRACR